MTRASNASKGISLFSLLTWFLIFGFFTGIAGPLAILFHPVWITIALANSGPAFTLAVVPAVGALACQHNTTPYHWCHDVITEMTSSTGCLEGSMSGSLRSLTNCVLLQTVLPFGDCVCMIIHLDMWLLCFCPRLRCNCVRYFVWKQVSVSWGIQCFAS